MGKEESKEYDKETLSMLSPISSPLAPPKLKKKLLKLIKKAAKEKMIRRGVKEVVKAIRKEQKGVVVIGGDISPLDVIAHLPVLCEDANIPYVYVPSRVELGEAALSKRPTSVILVVEKKGSEYSETLEECSGLMKKL
ncbi:L30e-like protein [Rozella allomycis CSF55]|uniref:H/ACA ribonucleoprotein complex subunit 2 n=1 Tax=Rozella allomycis (strain CSF55) TaxID=988480 RepID=A0A4P9YPY8_ROZAC|nr:L30e-like protein [Rozella allomycis CSF55]